MDEIVSHVLELRQRLQILEGRTARSMRDAAVTHVDPAKGLCRVRLGGTDAEPFLSPWVPYSQMAGAVKGHVPVSVGQNVTLFAPGGDLTQAKVVPFTWSDANASPGSGADPVWTYGSVKVEVKPGGIKVSVGGASVELTADQFLMTAELVKAVGSGVQGIAGQPFHPDAIGLLSARATYDAAAAGFSYVATDTSSIYFKRSATSGDWSPAIPFGVGPAGPIGATGPAGPAGPAVNLSDATPLVDGTAAPGTATAASRADHVHPTDTSRAAASHTHANATTSVAGFLSTADKTKLDGIASGATANATDAQLRDRATHTGAQAISTVTNLQTSLDAKFDKAGGVVSGIVTLGANYPFYRWGNNNAAWRMEKDTAEGALGKMHLRGTTDGFVASGLNVMTWDAANLAVGINQTDPYGVFGLGASFVINRNVAGFTGDLVINSNATVGTARAARRYITGTANSWFEQGLYDGDKVVEQTGTGVPNGVARRAAKHAFQSITADDFFVVDAAAAVVSVPVQGVGLASIGRQFSVKDKRFAGGAKGDGITDDTAEIQAAINAAIAAGGGIVYFPRGVYKITAPLSITTATCVYLLGEGDYNTGTVLDSYLSAADTVVFDNCVHSGIADMHIRGRVIPTGGYGVVFRNNCYRCSITGVRIDLTWNGVFVYGSTETRISGVQLRYLFGSFGVYFGGTSTSRSYRMVIDDLVADNPYPRNHGAVKDWAAATAFALNDIIYKNGRVWQCTQAGTSGATGPTTIPGTNSFDAFSTEVVDGGARWKFVCGDISWVVHDSYAYSLVVAKAALINGVHAVLQTDSAGVSGSDPSYPIWIFGWDVEMDHQFYANLALWHGEGVTLTGSWASSSLAGNAIEIASTHRGEIDIGQCRIAYAHYHGVTLSAGPKDVRIHDNTIGDNSQALSGGYHGVAVAAGAAGFQICNNRIGDIVGVTGNPQGYAVIINTGSSDDYIVLGNRCGGNVLGKVADGGTGTNKYVAGNV